MSLTVYWGSGSPVSWRVLLALRLKAMDFESIRLNLGEKQFRSPDYLKLNPRGTFPLLVSGELRIRGSLAILHYLEALQPSPSLLGESPEEIAGIWQCIDDHEDDLGPATQTLTRAFFRQSGDRSSENVDPAIAVVARELDLLEESLRGDWIVGDKISAADVVLYPTVHRLLRAASTAEAEGLREVVDEKLSRYPRLWSWLHRVGDLPGVNSTYPPHWRST